MSSPHRNPMSLGEMAYNAVIHQPAKLSHLAMDVALDHYSPEQIDAAVPRDAIHTASDAINDAVVYEGDVQDLASSSYHLGRHTSGRHTLPPNMLAVHKHIFKRYAQRVNTYRNAHGKLKRLR